MARRWGPWPDDTLGVQGKRVMTMEPVGRCLPAPFLCLRPGHGRGRMGRGRMIGVRRRGRTVLVALVLVLGVIGGWPGLTQAQAANPADELRSLEDRIAVERASEQALREKRKVLADELRRVRDQVIESAAAVQDAEENLSRLEDQLQALHDKRDQMDAALHRRDRQMAQVLTAIQRLAWRPTEALIVQPTPPADTVRSAILLRAAIPRIEENARALAEELRRVKGVDTAITAQQAEIEDQAKALRAAHERMQTLFDRKAALQRDTLEREREAAGRVERLGREARDLRDLVDRLEAERQRREVLEAERQAAEARRLALAQHRQQLDQENTHAVSPGERDSDISERDQAALNGSAEAKAVAANQVAAISPQQMRLFSKGRGVMPMPVRGRLMTRFGQVDDVGAKSKGISVRARAGAQVVAPYDGTVAFAGPFRGYGLLLIIEHTDGYHSLLAGMNRIDINVGQMVRAGEPVGVMGKGDPTLYIELRRRGQPINPLPWMAVGTDTGKG